MASVAAASGAGDATTSNPASVEELTMAVKWSGKEYTVRVCADDTVSELKRRICEVTNVLPKRQKLLNVKAGKMPADDSMLLSQLNLKPTIKIMMMGCVRWRIRCLFFLSSFFVYFYDSCRQLGF